MMQTCVQMKGLNFSDTSLQNSPSEEVSTKKNKNKNKKKKLASPVIKRIWNEDDELSILKVHFNRLYSFPLDPPLLTRCGI